MPTGLTMQQALSLLYHRQFFSLSGVHKCVLYKLENKTKLKYIRGVQSQSPESAFLSCNNKLPILPIYVCLPVIYYPRLFLVVSSLPW